MSTVHRLTIDRLRCPQRIEESAGRIVVVGSNAYKMGLKRIPFEDLNFDKNYTAWRSYAQSKLAQMIFAYELQRRVEAAGKNVTVQVCHPGASRTNLLQDTASTFNKIVWSIVSRVIEQSAEKGSWPEVICATEEEVESEKLYGPTKRAETVGPVDECALDECALDRAAAARLLALSEQIVPELVAVVALLDRPNVQFVKRFNSQEYSERETHMKAMLINSYGEDAKFEVADVDQPEVKTGHVLVRIAASSVNTVDTMIRKMGKELPLSPDTPAILGMDFAGTVEAVGDGVTNCAVGDEVYGCAGGLADLPGTLAEYIVADSDLIARKPRNLSMREAAALPLVAITAYEGLQRAGIKQGQTVLVHGGSGGVGHVAIQLARHWGADVYSTGGGDEQLELIEKPGATGINYKTESVEDYVARHTDGAGFDLVFDSVGGENLTKSFEAAALNGQIATTVSMCELDLTPAHFKGLSLHVVFMLIPMLHSHQRNQHAEILHNLAEIVESGGLKPVLDEKQFSLEEAGQAHARLESGKGMGKVVVANS